MLALGIPDHAVDFSGQVVSILDGDIIEVLHNQHPERGIDCPEKGQAYGKRAKQAASELVHGKEVTLKTHGKDKYGPSTTRPSGCWGRGPFPSSALSTRGRSGRGK